MRWSPQVRLEYLKLSGEIGLGVRSHCPLCLQATMKRKIQVGPLR